VFVKCRHFISVKELIFKAYIKFEFKPNNQTRSRRRGESLPGKPGGSGFAKPVAQVLGSVLFPLRRRQYRDSRDFPEIPDFPETPEKSLENPGFTDKFVLIGDFSGLTYSPPPSRRHQDPFKWYQSPVL
jgi:hypothetical protein